MGEEYKDMGEFTLLHLCERLKDCKVNFKIWKEQLSNIIQALGNLQIIIFCSITYFSAVV